MKIEEQLKEEILSRYKSIRAFTVAIGIPYSTLDSAFKRGLENAGIGTMLKVFCALDLDIESIRDGTLRQREPRLAKLQSEADERLKTISNIYRSLNPEGQSMILRYAEMVEKTGDYTVCGVQNMQKNTAAARSGDRMEPILHSREEEDAVLPPSRSDI